MTVLVWGAADDPPTAAVLAGLARLGVPHLRVADNVAGLSVDFEQGVVRVASSPFTATTVPLAEVTGVFVRPPPDEDAATSASFAALYALAACVEARVMNRPAAMASNHAKPYQLRRLAAAGFRVPETLVTTSPASARDFLATHGAVIYKSVSGVRSRVQRVGEAQRARLDDLRWCPTMFQRYVAGTDVRVHVAGAEVFACAVQSEADDYRYPQEGDAPARLWPVELPDAVRARCAAVCEVLALPLAGIDLRLGEDGAWYAFEVNPSPAFTCFDAAQAEAIAEAITRWLEGHHVAGSHRGAHVVPGHTP